MHLQDFNCDPNLQSYKVTKDNAALNEDTTARIVNFLSYAVIKAGPSNTQAEQGLLESKKKN